MATPILTEKDAARFYSKTRRNSENGCLEWVAGRYRFGYGTFWLQGAMRQAHRVAWEASFGPVPPSMCVLHACDNPPCVDVTHLFLGTLADNNADRGRKGRGAQQKRVACPAGHPYSGMNLIVRKGRRECRECNRVRCSAYNRRRRLVAIQE